MTTPGEARWKEMVAQLAQRVGLTPLDVEAATEGRVKAQEVLDLLTQQEGQETESPSEAQSTPADAQGPVEGPQQ